MLFPKPNTDRFLSEPTKLRKRFCIAIPLLLPCGIAYYYSLEDGPWFAVSMATIPFLISMLVTPRPIHPAWRALQVRLLLIWPVGLILGLVLASVKISQQEEQAMRIGDDIMDAIAAYLLAEGEYPNNLIHLVPEYLESIPMARKKLWGFDDEFLFWPSADKALGGIQFEVGDHGKWSRSLLHPWAAEGTYNWWKLAEDAPPIETHFALAIPAGS